MTLGERIKAHRQQAKMSQEALAAALGVSRQAVTKWESGQSAPSTENLFRLAELFGTTVDLLLPEQAAAQPQPDPAAQPRPDPAAQPQPDPAAQPRPDPAVRQMLELYRQEQQAKQAARRKRLRQNVRAALQIASGYLLVYLLGRVLWCDFSDSTVLGWLFLARPDKPGSYLYGWLLHKRLFWGCAAIAAGTALLGRHRAARVQLAYFVLGLWAGVWYGPVPYGSGEYGWAYWAALVLASFPVGRLWQKRAGARPDRRLLALTAASLVGAVVLVYLLIPKTVYGAL